MFTASPIANCGFKGTGIISLLRSLIPKFAWAARFANVGIETPEAALSKTTKELGSGHAGKSARQLVFSCIHDLLAYGSRMLSWRLGARR
jgi:hypothetical protein